MSDKKRYAIVGTGSRAGMFVQAIADTYKATAELVGLCDLSQVRMDWYNQQLGWSAEQIQGRSEARIEHWENIQV